MKVRAGGLWDRVGLGALRLRGADGVLEEAPRAQGLGGGPSGDLTPPGPSGSQPAARRPGFYRRPAGGDAEASVSLEGRPTRLLLSPGRVGG